MIGIIFSAGQSLMTIPLNKNTVYCAKKSSNLPNIILVFGISKPFNLPLKEGYKTNYYFNITRISVYAILTSNNNQFYFLIINLFKV